MEYWRLTNGPSLKRILTELIKSLTRFLLPKADKNIDGV